MECRQEPQKETNVRYVLENGKFTKMYVVKETDTGFYLRKKKILDIADPPQFYLKAFVYDNNAL